MRVSIILPTALTATTLLVACGGRNQYETTNAPVPQGEAQKEEAYVRVVHAIPEAPKADVYTGADKAWSGVQFGTVTPYKPVRDTEFTIALKPAGQAEGPIMVEAKEGIDAGRRYTIVAMPDRDGAVKIDALTDDDTPPAAGKAKVRIIHAAAEAGPVEILAPGKDRAKPDSVAGKVDFNSPARYNEVDASRVTVEVHPQLESKKATLAVQEDTLEAGKAYTFLVLPGGKPGQPVELIKIEEPVGVQPAQADSAIANPSGKQKAIQREESKDDQPPVKQPDIDELNRQLDEQSGKKDSKR